MGPRPSGRAAAGARSPGTPGGGGRAAGGEAGGASPAQAARHRHGARRRARRARRGAEAAAEAWREARAAGLAAAQALVNALLERRYLAQRPLGSLGEPRFRDLGLLEVAAEKIKRRAARELAAVDRALAGLEDSLHQFGEAQAILRGEEPLGDSPGVASPTGATPLSSAQYHTLEASRPVFSALPMPAYQALLAKVVAGYVGELEVKRGVHATLEEVYRSETRPPGGAEGAEDPAGEWEMHLAAWMLEPCLDETRLQDFCTLVDEELKAAG